MCVYVRLLDCPQWWGLYVNWLYNMVGLGWVILLNAEQSKHIGMITCNVPLLPQNVWFTTRVEACDTISWQVSKTDKQTDRQTEIWICPTTVCVCVCECVWVCACVHVCVHNFTMTMHIWQSKRERERGGGQNNFHWLHTITGLGINVCAIVDILLYTVFLDALVYSVYVFLEALLFSVCVFLDALLFTVSVCF